MTRLLDAFSVATSSTSPVGMTARRTDKPCQSCRALDILIVPGRGAHAAEYVCSVCGAHRGWMSREVFNFVSGCVVASLKTIGRRPEEPIIIRSKNSCSSTNKPRPLRSQPQPRSQEIHIMSEDIELTFDNMFPSSFLKASDLGGAPLLVTIESVTQEALKGGEQKNVMHFAGQDKALVLNKTNAKAIAALYGKKVSAWTGKRIVLVPAMVDFKGDTVEAIRVKAPAVKKPTAPPPLQDFDDDIPHYLPDNDIEAA